MIRRRDAQLLGHTVDLALADDGAGNTGGVPMHDHDNENKEGDGDGEKVPRAYRGSNHGGSLASMEEGAVAPGVGREPSVSLSLSAAVSHATTAAAAAAAGRGEAPLPPVVEQQQGQEPSTGGGGLVVALMRTLRLDGGGGGGGGVGEEEKPPPSSAPRASQGRKKGSRVSPQAQQEEGERGRGASSASSALSSSSASSTRSRRVLGMDEPTAVAAALVAMSAFIYSLESVNVKLLGKDVGFWTISVWVRGKFMCVGVPGASKEPGAVLIERTHFLPSKIPQNNLTPNRNKIISHTQTPPTSTHSAASSASSAARSPTSPAAAPSTRTGWANPSSGGSWRSAGRWARPPSSPPSPR